jgi:Ca2+-binding EF-hand superfamily protein
MKTVRAAFEKEIRNKLALKSNGKQSEEAILIKSFKYFDLNNSGECEKDEWVKSLNKIGITGFNEQKLLSLFDGYDKNNSGGLDYKEFVTAVYNLDDEEEEQSTPKKQNSKKQESGDNEPLKNSKVMDKFREKILSRGGKGILGLARQFKIFDDNHSMTLDLPELTKAIRDFRVDLSPNEIKVLFNLIDVDQSGEVSYDEFLREIRGDMNNARKKFVDQAFSKLDLDKSGVVEFSEIKQIYNVKKHPDVLSGKKTEDEAFMDFIETFQLHASIKGKGVTDDEITRQEFQEYYENISASIDRDDYFALMMTNAWKLGERPSYEGRSAWRNEDKDKSDSKGGAFAYNKRAKDTSIPVSQKAPWGTSEGKTSYNTSNNANQKSLQIGKGGSGNMLKFREAVARRGVRGIMSLRRSFMIADDNNNKQIDINEFTKLIHDYRIPVESQDVRALFGEFDLDKSGEISYDEFLRGVCGEMNDFRMALAKRAFKVMDKDGSGEIDINDLRGVYNAKFHPDVKAGKKTEDEVLAEFLDTFEYHFNLLNDNKSKDRTITMEEWIEYYNNISMSIDNDKYFELMMTNAWNLDGKKVTKKGWGGEV